jgi:4-hydroxy-L-threonine phosphate dehydrogenase PdxA
MTKQIKSERVDAVAKLPINKSAIKLGDFNLSEI